MQSGQSENSDRGAAAGVEGQIKNKEQRTKFSEEVVAENPLLSPFFSKASSTTFYICYLRPVSTDRLSVSGKRFPFSIFHFAFPLSHTYSDRSASYTETPRYCECVWLRADSKKEQVLIVRVRAKYLHDQSQTPWVLYDSMHGGIHHFYGIGDSDMASILPGLGMNLMPSLPVGAPLSPRFGCPYQYSDSDTSKKPNLCRGDNPAPLLDDLLGPFMSSLSNLT